jgi:manganese/zinc/iron transport system ATP- binding protein
MLNVQVIGAGPVNEIFTGENLKRAYGGQIALLDKHDVANASSVFDTTGAPAFTATERAE